MRFMFCVNQTSDIGFISYNLIFRQKTMINSYFSDRIISLVKIVRLKGAWFKAHGLVYSSRDRKICIQEKIKTTTCFLTEKIIILNY